MNIPISYIGKLIIISLISLPKLKDYEKNLTMGFRSNAEDMIFCLIECKSP